MQLIGVPTVDGTVLTILLLLAALVLLDLAALRYGVNSRHSGDDRRDWW